MFDTRDIARVSIAIVRSVCAALELEPEMFGVSPDDHN
jgi:hypothetical protein